MQQSPISFKFLLIGLAASVLINGAALYLFLFAYSHKLVTKRIENSRIVFVDMFKAIEKSQKDRQKNRHKMIIKQVSRKTAKPEMKSGVEIKHKTLTARLKTKQKVYHRHKMYASHLQKSKHTQIALKKIYPPANKIERNRQKLKRKSLSKVVLSNAVLIKAGSNKHLAARRKKLLALGKSLRLCKLKVMNISRSSNESIFLWINKHKFYPMEALYKEQEGKIGLSFTINSNGFITGININSPSGYNILNKAAVRIVKNSSPIPKTLLSSISSFPAKAKINIVFKLE